MISPSPQAFSDLLAKGLGRAHVILEADPQSAGTAEALISACLTDLAYDRQVENSRAPYLYELVELAGMTELVATTITRSLDDRDADDYAIAQRWELAGLLARGGAVGLRDAMRTALERLADHWTSKPGNADPPSEPARQLVLLDGLDGALFAFGQLGRVAVSHEEYWETELLLDEARSELGSDLDPALADGRRHDPNIDAYLRAVEADAAASADRSARRAEHHKAREGMSELPWSEAQRQIESEVRGTGRLGMRWSQWGKTAPEPELHRSAAAARCPT